MSAIIRACGLLARAWESENDPRNTELGVVPDIAREMSVAAQREYDQLRADLATVKEQCNRQEHGFARRENALQTDLAKALRAYDDEVTGRREEVTRCHTELGQARASLAAVTAERDSAQKHLQIACLELDGSEAEFEAERAAHERTRQEMNGLHRLNSKFIVEHQADMAAYRQQYGAEITKLRAELATALARVQSASLLLDKCECPALSTQIQLWQLETP